MRKNRNRSSELDGKNDNEAPKKPGLPKPGALLFIDVVCKEKAARANAAADEQKNQVMALTPDEIDLLRECMKRTEDYYRGLLLLKQDWNAAQNEAAIAMIKGQAEYDR